MSAARTTSVVVWQQPDRLWRWRWVERNRDGDEETSLMSHLAFDSASEAESSARGAYPDVVVHLPRGMTASPRRSRRPRRVLWLVLAVAGGAALGYRARRRRR